MISPCACLGPQCGEKFCPCVMETYDLERSTEWKHRNSPEELAKVNAELKAVFNKHFGVEE